VTCWRSSHERLDLRHRCRASPCDFCAADEAKNETDGTLSLQASELALYDGMTDLGPWANMCEPHYALHGGGLGTGRGQRLVLKDADYTVVDDAGAVIAQVRKIDLTNDEDKR
jgi:hypothetical protein